MCTVMENYHLHYKFINYSFIQLFVFTNVGIQLLIHILKENLSACMYIYITLKEISVLKTKPIV